MRRPTLCPQRSLRGSVPSIESLKNAAQERYTLLHIAALIKQNFHAKKAFPLQL